MPVSTRKQEALPLELARRLFIYDPASGKIFARSNGKSRGFLHRGYQCLIFKGALYRIHRIAWLLHYGKWPHDQIDHINGDRADNRLLNLRECTPAQNSANRRAWAVRSHPLKGISPSRGKWAAFVTIDRRSVRVGTFDTPEQAHEAYAKKAREVYGEFARFA